MDDRNSSKRSLNLKIRSFIAIIVILIAGMGNTFLITEKVPAYNSSTAETGRPWLLPALRRMEMQSGWRLQVQDQIITEENSVSIPVDQNRKFRGSVKNGQVSPDNGNEESASYEKGMEVKNVNSIIVDKNNIKWFCSDDGILSYDGVNWKRYRENDKLPARDLKGVIYVVDTGRSEIWIASPQGATVAELPLDEQADVITLDPENSGILSQDVLGIAIGNNSIRWIGTRLGISALKDDKWLTPEYQMHYTKNMFRDFPITSMATNPEGDSLYVGTAGAGVARVYRDELDAISGASVYAEWGPIIMPSDHILSVFIASDGVKWFGTDKGIARHTGNETLDNWTAYNTDDGLIDNYVQAISGDRNGNMWFGTKAGISVFDGSSWTSYTTEEGLASNNILSLAIDHDGIVWIGTDVGIMSYESGEFIEH